MVTLEFIKEKMSKLRGEWAIEENKLIRDWNFNNFKEAVLFVNKVAEVAERINHHPIILIDYDHVRLTLVTHENNGITEKDFLLAEEIDKIS